jgi:hypothetical protein
MPQAHTDAAVFWAIGGAAASQRGGFAKVRKSVFSDLRLSIRSASQQVHDVAFVLMHEGGLNCTHLAANAMGLPCTELPRTPRPWTEASTTSDKCVLGPPSLQANWLFLVQVDPFEHQLHLVRDELFSFRTCGGCFKPFFGGSSSSRKLGGDGWRTIKAHQSLNSTTGKKQTPRYGEALGYGTWYRYVAHRILVPLGIRRALYLDGDTCVVRPLQGLFQIARNVTSPLVVSRRAVPQWKLRYWLGEKGTDVKLASARWGFQSWPDGEVHMFNAGVIGKCMGAHEESDTPSRHGLKVVRTSRHGQRVWRQPGGRDSWCRP